MQDRCKVYMDIVWIMFHGHLDCFQKPPLGGTPNTKPGDHALRTVTTLGLFYSIQFYSIMSDDPHEERFIEIAFD